MRIQHNIMALNAYRQLGGNNSALAKNLEKLSSGYAINRAGDDAAGLAISEKMRAQIKGLEAAQKNANDGISLVQTAEGALTEVHSMLNRMVYLATQSANGTYDNEVDRANLDKEVQTLKEEINRISQSTNFNGLKLLDGSMDADASVTTGGTTDVPILQEVATNPTLEVGTKTVLHKDADKQEKTEINIELHNVTSTSKTKAGDSIKFTVGDAEIELKVRASKKDPNDENNIIEDDTVPGYVEATDLLAGKTYSAAELVDKIMAKFNAGDQLIGGQKFTATADRTKNSVKFEQIAPPNDRTEVVNANVEVKVEYVTNPSGNPVDYTMNIEEDALKDGSSITIGGDKYTFGEAGSDFENIHSLTDIKLNAPVVTKKGYQLSYNNGTLTITDPNGKLGAPTVKYDGYDVTQPVDPLKVDGATGAGASGTFTVTGFAGTAANGDKVEVNYTGAGGAVTEKFTYNGTKWVADSGADADLTLTHAADGKFTLTSATLGAGKNGTIAAGGVTYTRAITNNTVTENNFATTGNATAGTGTATGTYTLAAPAETGDTIEWNGDKWTWDGSAWAADAANDSKYVVDATSTASSFKVNGTDDVLNATDDLVVTYANRQVDATFATTGQVAGTTPTSGTLTLDLDPTEGTEISWHGQKWTYTNGAWNGDAANTFVIEVADPDHPKSLTIKGKDATITDVNAATGGPVTVKYGASTNADEAKMENGANGKVASKTFDLSGANLKDGDKIIVTDSTGAKTEFVFKTDLATTFGANLQALVDKQTGLKATGAVGVDGAEVNGGAEALTVDATGFANNKVIISSNAAGDDSTIPALTIEYAKMEEKTGEVKTAANADTITGTWNVQSTKNKQGASPDSGQLASTTFDFTAEMAQDGNSLTIGKETYVFRVGKDSTVKAGAGETIVDLKNVEANDPDFVNKAMAALKNAALNNGAFTVGGAKDSGKISIHEKEGQTVFTDGELESVESFDKLVYMKSPEVTTATGKGLTFQVGDTADDFQKVSLSIHDMSSEGLGIADVNITTIEDAASAIDKIKTAINTVSSQRGDLGAIQNRLEHTINNLGVQTENITAAESRIRDTDMAQEMMAYTKNNILVQAAQAMLAQANQVPQGVLQLLQ